MSWPGWIVAIGTGAPVLLEPFQKGNPPFTAYRLVFPLCGLAHSYNYVWNKPLSPSILGKSKIVMSWTVQKDDGAVWETPGDDKPATFSLFMQRTGDDGMTGVGPAEFYRLWAKREVLANGDYQIERPLTWDNWTGVYGHNPTPAQFADTISNLAHIGFTFGGASFAGHGVCATGYARFVLNDYAIQ